MVKKTNQRIMITLPKECINGLQKIADMQSTTISKVIFTMCTKKSTKLFEQVKENCSIKNQMTLYDLSKVKWIDD